VRIQEELGASAPPPVRPSGDLSAIGGCFVCFAPGPPGPGRPGDPGWAAASLGRWVSIVEGRAPYAYEPGLLALREGPLLEQAVRGLPEPPDLLLVNATGRDHPRGAGLAFHLGAVLGVPTIGVTHRPLIAAGPWPEDERGAASPLRLDGELVGYWVRTKRGARPLAVHAGWATDPDAALTGVLAAAGPARTPEPLRAARAAAREARAGAIIERRWS
jgi:deoxyribonuclease V